MLSNAIIKSLYPGSSIVQGLRAFPQLVSTAFTINIGTFLGRILYPFGISFLLPIFVITITREKEDRIAIMMQMYGLKLSTYYFAHWLHFFVLYFVSAAVFILSGLAFQQQLFTVTDGGVIVILFLCWGLAQISLAFFFSAFFSKSRNALVVTFLLVLMSVIVNVTMETLFTGQAPAAYLLYPAFAFYRGLILLNNAATTKGAKPYTMAMLQGDNEVLRCIVFLIWETFVYLALAYYFSQVLPSQFGVQKKWYVISFSRLLSAHNKKLEEADRHNYAVVVNQDETQFEDQDVKAERARVDENKFSSSAPLVVRHMRKIYPGTRKIAVKDVTFAAESGECFGLLGPNGAGKSSLISILTGLYEPTLGEATLGGYDIKSQRKYVYRITGICPQHDILWDDLSVGEHLLFYARLKGIPPDQEEEAKNRALEAVSLQNFEHRLSKGLSGGEKRRLSIAIALTGDPRVVFFDEPTTGLDPEVRRVIWNILSAARKGKTVVLTTHSMEEAETLCTRIGIMAKGTLRCVGSQIRLKKLYGAGFKITYIAQPENMAHATEKIKQVLPANAKVVDSFAMATTVEFMPAEGTLNTVFEALQQHSKEWLIDDWGISQTSLEEVFLRLISETDAEGSAE
ncbi:P-loop containing nucleoside triphosphate hydrolase protein [Catenaria anguillulae PL171]|uniref:p-loop containing nucleoside triphosphate hydrolase protein n=1 Tax=Catenaria anguillulae PL171 TaxID=765915 RepID=A0A1Y2H8B6_9FUNG|nr:P-loop containing nucleoside triphosphate hydrolase protein [Catenaria anguillulae PL171]